MALAWNAAVRRGRLSRALAAVCMVAAALALGVAVVGCAEWRLDAEVDRAAVRQDELAAQADRLGSLLQAYRQAVDAGVPPQEALARLRAGVGSELEAAVVAAIDVAVASGVALPDAVASARAGLEGAVREIVAYRVDLEKYRAEARASDDGWFGLGDALVGALTVAVPGLGGAWVVGKRLLRKGEGIGAAAVRDSIRAGREADPVFDRMFEGDSVAARVMRATLDVAPHAAEVVRSGRAHKPRRPASVSNA